MKKIITIVLILILVFASVFAKELNIVHLNDFHGRLVPQVQKIYKNYSYTVAGAEYISAIVNNIKQKEKNVLLFDAGDFSAGTIYSNLSNGLSVVDFYNYLKFDAVALGNHEFDFGYDAMKNMVRRLSAPVLCANAYPLFDNTKPFVIINKDGLRVAVIGLLTPETKIITMPNALNNRDIIDPVETLNKYKNDILAQNPDLVVVLSHCGVKEDERIAKNVDFVDLIIGGHSHTELFEPIVVENNNKKIYIVQAGSYGKYVGHIKLNVENKKIKSFSYSLYPTINAIINPDKNAYKVVQNYIVDAEKYSSEVIGFSDVELNKDSKDIDKNLGTFITNVLSYMTNSDIAFYNHGGIRDVLNKGEITYGEIFNILPFENTVVKFKMKGSDLISLLDSMDQKKTKLHYNDSLENINGKWFLRGKELKEDEYYTVATVDFLYYGGDGYTEFSKFPVLQNYGYARELIVDFIKKNSPIKSSRLILTSK